MKGFVSLEYVLLMAGVITILGSIVAGIIVLYHRNISAIDNLRLSDFCKELKSTIELFEIMPEGKEILEPMSLTDWKVEKSTNYLEITNSTQECNARTSNQLTIKISTITPKQEIIITKQNNVLNIS